VNVQTLPLSSIGPNPWNPNEQTARQYEAERESLSAYGFVQPILVRRNPDDASTYQIIDGEHRWRAMNEFADLSTPAGKVEDLVAERVIPAVVVDVDDNTARKLTVIMNETRGEANAAKLADLLAELSNDMDVEALLIGLPYTEKELNDLVNIGEFDWSKLVPDASSFEPNEKDATQRVVCALTEIDYDRLNKYVKRLNEEYDLPDDKAKANGIALTYLLDKGEQQ
jgi:ParB/RepB/Spo0J family partition protein